MWKSTASVTVLKYLLESLPVDCRPRLYRTRNRPLCRPRRVNVTMLIGAPILVQQVDEPTAEQIDAVHDRLLSEMKTLFDTHKDALGWGHKKIIFE